MLTQRRRLPAPCGSGTIAAMAKKSKPREPVPVTQPLTELLRLPAGTVDLGTLDPSATTGFPGTRTTPRPDRGPGARADGAAGAAVRDRPRRAPGARRVLVVLQGMDTSGKGGVIRHAIGMVGPAGRADQGVQGARPTRSAPTTTCGGSTATLPRARDDRHLRPVALRGRADRPGERPGRRRRSGARRYDEINAWEAELVAAGTVVVKCFLHISLDEQKERLRRASRRPDQALEVQPRRRRRARQVARLRRGLRGRAGALQHPATRPGSSSRPTASGTATGPSPSCWSSTCARSTCSGRRPTSTSRARSCRLALT